MSYEEGHASTLILGDRQHNDVSSLLIGWSLRGVVGMDWAGSRARLNCHDLPS